MMATPAIRAMRGTFAGLGAVAASYAARQIGSVRPAVVNDRPSAAGRFYLANHSRTPRAIMAWPPSSRTTRCARVAG
jgi:hypothetical protein